MLVPLFCLAGCAGSRTIVLSEDGTETAVVPESISIEPPTEPRQPTGIEALARFEGRYRISRQLERDGCGGRIVGRAQTLVVDAERRIVHADRVERHYHARVEGDRLIAENRFTETICPESTHFARWTLERMPDGSLDGTVESQWLLPPCSSPCVVRFHIQATPIP